MPANAPGVGFLQAPAGPLTPDELEEDKEKTLHLRFLTHEARCGDSVAIEGTARNVDDGASLDIELKGAKTEKVSGKMKKRLLRSAISTASDGKGPLTWVANGAIVDKPEQEIELSGKAGGVSGKSLEMLPIRVYDDTGSSQVSINIPLKKYLGERADGSRVREVFERWSMSERYAASIKEGFLHIIKDVQIDFFDGPWFPDGEVSKQNALRTRLNLPLLPVAKNLGVIPPPIKAQVKLLVEREFKDKWMM
ncbi:MAG: hypothetical protein JNG84_00620, partial [Archangium sp.]|nr:hypothetical protein [Archangium sp.]